jgi:hypothetical protein
VLHSIARKFNRPGLNEWFECLPSKHKAFRSNPRTAKKKEEGERREKKEEEVEEKWRERRRRRKAKRKRKEGQHSTA